MSVDNSLRAEGERLRERVHTTLDVEAAFDDLRGQRRRRRWRAGLASAVAAAAAAAAVTTTAGWLPSEGTTAPPADQPSSDAPTEPVDEGGCLATEHLQCLGGGTVRVRGPVTYRVTIPQGFVLEEDMNRAPLAFDAYRRHADAGVAILTGVAPAGTTRAPDARGVAAWVAARPFLEAGEIVRDRVGGLPAWSVEVGPADPEGAPEPGRACNGQLTSCWPTLRQDDGYETGPWSRMTSRYRFVDVPGQGVLAVWSWTRDSAATLRANERLVRTLAVESAG